VREGRVFVDELSEYLDGLDWPWDVGSPWPEVEEGDTLWEVDWPTLLDPERDGDYVFPDEYADRHIHEAPRPSVGWDVCAWYQPIHFYRTAWGIFIRAECLESVAFQLARYLFPGARRVDGWMWWRLRRAAFVTVFLHEQYHHKIESFAIRLAVAEGHAFYPRYSRDVYAPARGSDALLEEALANADAYARLAEPTYRRALGPQVEGIRAYLRDEFVSGSPPGYRLAIHLLDPSSFSAAENELCDEVRLGVGIPSASAPRWRFASQMTRAMYSIRSETYVVVRGAARSPLPGAPALSMSSKDVERFLRHRGYAPQPARGDHMKWEKSGSPSIVIPKRRDLSPGVLADVARRLGLGNAYGLAEAIREA
jgi:predicted RNA binding protein YcfA (HicA-like mRNA interferase family)